MIVKLYDAYCHSCNVWYGSKHYIPKDISKQKSITYMRQHGWRVTKDVVLCEMCTLGAW